MPVRKGLRRHVPDKLPRVPGIDNRVPAPSLIHRLMSNEQNGRRVEGDVVELTEWPEIVLAIFAGGADPSDWTWDHEAFERVVLQARRLTLWRLVEDIWMHHVDIPSSSNRSRLMIIGEILLDCREIVERTVLECNN